MNEDFFFLDIRPPETGTLGTRGHTPNKLFKLFHQNIRCLRVKASELLCYLHQDLPHLLCFLEQHLSQSEADFINIEDHSIGTKYCRRKLQRGGVSIFIQSHLHFTTVAEHFNIVGCAIADVSYGRSMACM